MCQTYVAKFFQLRIFMDHLYIVKLGGASSYEQLKATVDGSLRNISLACMHIDPFNGSIVMLGHTAKQYPITEVQIALCVATQWFH